ncbi:S24 family peptidase [Pseudomonas sp.]|uniref:LexA family protein n=1 Tax=Pseudomonas sp. TaxID=306 RepID=UPI00257BBC1A|nr:S24 family peptidase [Pseudomonas sp.]
MDFSNRLKNRMRDLGLTGAEIAALVGVSKGAVTHWTNGTNQANGKRLLKLAEVLQCDATWLATGATPSVRRLASGALYAPTAESNVEMALQPGRNAKEYPMISWVAAGDRAESPDNHHSGDGEEMIESTENAGPHGYWLKVKGKSMTSDTPPSFPPGTPVLVQPEGFDVISGKFYIAKHRDGETTFKQYVRDAGTAYLSPLNPAFKSVEMDEEWRLIGRVIDAKITGL